ncbi:MAG: hypothetical protein WBA17_09760 [Saprospiraceae bacterium]
MPIRRHILPTAQFLLTALLLLSAACEKEPTMVTPMPGEPVVEVGDLRLLWPADFKNEVAAETELLRWTAPAPGASYQLKISLNPDLSDPLVMEEGLTDTTFALTGRLERSTTYYWTVAADLEDRDPIVTPAARSFRTVLEAVTSSPEVVNYYVSPAGRDVPGGGTQALPFRSLGYASRRVPAGENDTIFLAPGTYVEQEAALIGPAVNVIGAGVDEVTLTSAGVRLPNNLNPNFSDFKLWFEGSLIQLTSPARVIPRNVSSAAIAPTDGRQEIAGFTIDGQNKQLKAGLWVENRNNVHLHDLRFVRLRQRGAVVAGGEKKWYREPDHYLTGIRIHDLSFVDSGKDIEGETLGNLNLAQLDGAEIYNIDIEDSEGYGIKFIFDGYFRNTHIHDCRIQLAENDPLWGEDIAIELWNLGPGNEVDHIECNNWLSLVNHPEIFGQPTGYENLRVHHVRIVDGDTYSSKEGFEIGVPGVELYENYVENKGFAVALWDMGRGPALIRNNVFYNSTDKQNWAGAPAIYIDNSRDWEFSGYTIVNNVFDRQRIGVRIKGGNVSNVLIANNAFINTEVVDVESSAVQVRVMNNIKYTADNTAWSFAGTPLQEQTNNYTGDPEFRYSGPRWDTYYLPAPGGFAIDKGLDVGLPYTGSAPDLGVSKQ